MFSVKKMKNDCIQPGSQAFEKRADFTILCLLFALTLVFYMASLSGLKSFFYQGLMGISILIGAVLMLPRKEEIPQMAKGLPFFSYFLSVFYQLLCNWSLLDKAELAFGGVKVAYAFLMLVLVEFFLHKRWEASIWRTLCGLMTACTLFVSFLSTFLMVAHLTYLDTIDGMGCWNGAFCEAAFVLWMMQLIRPAEYKINPVVFWRYIRSILYGILVISVFMTEICIRLQDFPGYRIVIGIWLPYILMFLFLFLVAYSFVSRNNSLYYLEEEKEYMKSVSELLALIEAQTKLYEKRMANTDEVTKKLLEEEIRMLRKDKKDLCDEMYSEEEIEEMIEEKKKSLGQEEDTAIYFEDLGNEKTVNELIEKETIRQKYIVTIGEMLCKDNQSNQAILQLGEYVSGRSDEIEAESRMILYYAGLIRHDGTIPAPVREIMREIGKKGV